MKLRVKESKRKALIGLHVCDELPVIGPASFDKQILMAGGFSGYGLSWGFWAGNELARLILELQVANSYVACRPRDCGHFKTKWLYGELSG